MGVCQGFYMIFPVTEEKDPLPSLNFHAGKVIKKGCRFMPAAFAI